MAKVEYQIDGGGWIEGTGVVIPASPDGSNDGEHVVEYRSTDFFGHAETAKSVTVKIDAGSPTTSVSGADNAWHDSDVSLGFSGDDGAGSGVAKVEYRIDGGGWVEGTGVVIPASLDGSNDGEHVLEYRSTDAAGHVETAKSVTVRIDVAAPTTSVSGADTAWHDTDVTLGFSGSDAGSGVAKVEYQIDGGGWVEGTELTVPAPVDGSNDGEHVVEYRSTDVMGHVEATRHHTVRIGHLATRARYIRHKLDFLRVTWPAVPGAASYEVRVNDDLIATTDQLTVLHHNLWATWRHTTVRIEVVALDDLGAEILKRGADRLMP